MRKADQQQQILGHGRGISGSVLQLGLPKKETKPTEDSSGRLEWGDGLRWDVWWDRPLSKGLSNLSLIFACQALASDRTCFGISLTPEKSLLQRLCQGLRNVAENSCRLSQVVSKRVVTGFQFERVREIASREYCKTYKEQVLQFQFVLESHCRNDNQVVDLRHDQN